MALRYKIDMLKSLKDAGYSTYRLRMDNIFWDATIAQLRNGELVSWENLGIICEILNCQPGDLLEYIPEF